MPLEANASDVSGREKLQRLGFGANFADVVVDDANHWFKDRAKRAKRDVCVCVCVCFCFFTKGSVSKVGADPSINTGWFPCWETRGNGMWVFTNKLCLKNLGGFLVVCLERDVGLYPKGSVSKIWAETSTWWFPCGWEPQKLLKKGHAKAGNSVVCHIKFDPRCP